jgi:hypothetical protein
MTEQEYIKISANMICKAEEKRYNFSKEEQPRFLQAAEIVLETIPDKPHQKSFERFHAYIKETM